jgi:uncharacterized protein (TIGR01777 family)
MESTKRSELIDERTSSSIESNKILVTGASGLVGTALRERLAADGRRAVPLLRGASPWNGTPGVTWDPSAGTIDEATLATIGAEAVVHLAGENIADGRWTAAKMEAIRASRVEGTRLLCEALARLERKPEVLVAASAIGFYGDRGDEALTEGSGAGQGFLPDVCSDWERATEPARAAGIRVVNLRIGVVLAREGGALATMLTPFKLGLGGRIGSGDQFMSWISLDDVVSAICRAIEDDRMSGPVNATAPEPVTNRDFTKTLGQVLRRPTFAAMPAFAARLVFGRMAQDLLLASLRVVPEKLLAGGFQFRHPRLEDALRDVLGRSR